MAVSAKEIDEDLIRTRVRRHYKPRYRLKWLKSKGAILIVIWSYLTFSVYHGMVLGSKSIFVQSQTSQSPTGIILISLALLCPVGGWLADSYLGRYKTIRYTTWIMWISVILIMLWEILNKYVVSEYLSKQTEIKVSILVILYLLLGIGLVGFQANIIQLGVDQLTDASSMEITSFILSYAVTLYTSELAFHFVNSCYINDGSSEWYNLLMMLYVAVSLTLVICIDFIFGSCLVKESVPVTTNSITLIAKVLKYVLMNRKHKTGDIPSNMFDIAKHTFGGPFEDQRVEHVKTFLKMLVVVSISSVVLSQIIVFAYAQGELQLRFHDWSTHNCYVRLSIDYSDYVVGTIIILFYEIFIYPLFYRCFPTVHTANLFLFGVFLSFLRILCFLGIEIGAYSEQTGHSINASMLPIAPKSCRHDNTVKIEFSSLWIIVIGSLEGLYMLLFIVSGYLFLWAWAPSSMKGLIFGMTLGFLGLNVMFQSAISAPFLFADLPWHRVPLSCGIWYFMMQAVITIVVFVMLHFIARRYREDRKREMCLNPVSIADDPQPPL